MTGATITEVGFYHLLDKPLTAVLPKLLEKALAAGLKPLVWAHDATLLAQLDRALWTYDVESFLPHGVVEGDVGGESQPIALSTAMPAGERDLIAVVGGGWPTVTAGLRRILYLFDGNDPAALTAARWQWKAVKADVGLAPVYWKETARGWEKAG